MKEKLTNICSDAGLYCMQSIGTRNIELIENTMH